MHVFPSTAIIHCIAAVAIGVTLNSLMKNIHSSQYSFTTSFTKKLVSHEIMYRIRSRANLPAFYGGITEKCGLFLFPIYSILINNQK